MPRIGIVIPTAFTRPEYLPLSYSSIANQVGDFELDLVVGAPPEKLDAIRAVLPPGARCVEEEDLPSLAAKLDRLLTKVSEDCEYIGWLGDDDLLTPGSLAAALEAFQSNPGAAAIYGGCDYMDSRGRVIFRNPSGRWASKILTFGPQLIPQPGSLMSRKAYEGMGGLIGKYQLAFDFDMFLKLQKQGPLIFVPKTLAMFRWHPDSLSVKKRMRSVLEASKVRFSHYTKLQRAFCFLWEPLVILATWLAGKLVTLRIRSLVR